MTVEKFDIVDFVMGFEDGSLDEPSIVEGFQYMINSGLVWCLQGFYGRTATNLIEEGICKTANEWTPQEARENFKINFESNH